jgi:hypothetical protein
MDLRAYFAGFVDGEGCFTVSFSPRSKLLIGWEVRPTDRSGKTLKYEVRCLDDLVERIIPFFEANPLLSSKQRDFEDSLKSADWCATRRIALNQVCERSSAWRWR